MGPLCPPCPSRFHWSLSSLCAPPPPPPRAHLAVQSQQNWLGLNPGGSPSRGRLIVPPRLVHSDLAWVVPRGPRQSGCFRGAVDFKVSGIGGDLRSPGSGGRLATRIRNRATCAGVRASTHIHPIKASSNGCRRVWLLSFPRTEPVGSPVCQQQARSE